MAGAKAEGLALSLTSLLSSGGAGWAATGNSAALTLASRSAVTLVVMQQAVAMQAMTMQTVAVQTVTEQAVVSAALSTEAILVVEQAVVEVSQRDD